MAGQEVASIIAIHGGGDIRYSASAAIISRHRLPRRERFGQHDFCRRLSAMSEDARRARDRDVIFTRRYREFCRQYYATSGIEPIR